MTDGPDATAAKHQDEIEVKKEDNPYLKRFEEAAARVQRDVLESDDPKVIPVREELSSGFGRVVLKRSSELKP
jgi:hypothetical protein